MGIDWQPFRLKEGVERIVFEKMLVQQRLYFLEWFRRGHSNLFYPSIEKHIDLGTADDMPQYADSFRLTVITNNPIFPSLWNEELFTTCFPDEAQKIVDKRIEWIKAIRNEGMTSVLKLEYVDQSDEDVFPDWQRFIEKAHDTCIDEFFEWSQKWINRGYGMFLSF